MLDRVTNITYRTSGGATVGAFAYAYDADGLVTQKVEVSAGGASVTHAYGYDGIGRLVAADGVTYTYDLAGNRLSRSGAGVPPAAYSYSHNRLNGDLYDAAGCVTNMFRNGVELSLSWNTQGQLVSVSTNNAFAESYVYDALGRRVATTTYPLNALGVLTPLTTYHVYDGHQCAADVDGSGRPLRTYAWGPGIDNLLAMTVFGSAETNTFFAVKDHLGSVHALVDAQGEIAQTFTYDAWGNACVSTPNSSFLTPDFSCRYLFQGREYSAATGLYNFRARWYDPVSGRWLSKDPIGLEGGLNLYAFCGEDPVNFVDPWGLLVEVHSRPVQNSGGAAAHTYITVTGPSGLIYTFVSYNINGNNVAMEDNPSDVNTPRTSSIVIPPPPGMTQDEWDCAVRRTARARVRNQRQEYKLLGGDGGMNSGNCHTTTSGIITRAGGAIPENYDPPGANPGLHR